MRKSVVLFFTLSFIMILVLIIGEFSSLSLSSIKETKDKNILLQINKLIIDSKELLDIARANSALDLILEQEVPLALSDNDMITLFITNSFITPQLITDNYTLSDEYLFNEIIRGNYKYELEQKYPYINIKDNKWIQNIDQLKIALDLYIELSNDINFQDLIFSDDTIENRLIFRDTSEDKSLLKCNLKAIIFGYDVKVTFLYEYKKNSIQKAGDIVEVDFTYKN